MVAPMRAPVCGGATAIRWSSPRVGAATSSSLPMMQMEQLLPSTDPVDGTDPWDGLLATAVIEDNAAGLQSRLLQGGLVDRARLAIAGPIFEGGRVQLSCGSWPMVVECESATLVQWAAWFGYYEVLEVLLLNGGSATATSEVAQRQGDLAPFLLASMGGNNRCLCLLASHHADINVLSPLSCYSALHYAATYVETPGTLKTLIDLGVDLDIVSSGLETALYIAVEFGDVDAIRLLGAAGANVNTPRPLLFSNHGVRAHWYMSRVEIRSPFVLAVANNDLASMKELILLGADASVPGTDWVQSANYDDQVLQGNATVQTQLRPWAEEERWPLDQQSFFTFLMSTRGYGYSSHMGQTGRGLVAAYLGLRSRVERGRLRRVLDAIRSDRVRACSSWPWCDGAYYIQYQLPRTVPPPDGEADPVCSCRRCTRVIL